MTTNETVPAGALDWYRAYLVALDSRDAVAVGAFLADDCEFGMNDDEPIRGRDAVVAAMAGYFAAFAVLRHETLGLVGDDRELCGEIANHFERHDGGRVTVHTAGLIRRDVDGAATRIRIYGDLGPAFAPA